MAADGESPDPHEQQKDRPENLIGEAPNTSTASAALGNYAKLWGHLNVPTLIVANIDFIVFIDAAGRIDWETTDDYDEKIKNNSKYTITKHNAVFNEAAVLEATPCDGVSEKSQAQFKRLIAEAMVCSLDHDYVSAENMLTSARRYFQARSEEISRRWYLTSCFAIAAPISAAGLIIWVNRLSISEALGETTLWIFISICLGSIGALFSVITRSGKMKYDSSAGILLHFLEGGSRIIAGSISGMLTSLAVKAGIILSALAKGGDLHLVMAMSAIAAGAGERLATSIISKFEDTHPKQKSSQTEKPTSA